METKYTLHEIAGLLPGCVVTLRDMDGRKFTGTVTDFPRDVLGVTAESKRGAIMGVTPKNLVSVRR